MKVEGMRGPRRKERTSTRNSTKYIKRGLKGDVAWHYSRKGSEKGVGKESIKSVRLPEAGGSCSARTPAFF